MKKRLAIGLLASLALSLVTSLAYVTIVVADDQETAHSHALNELSDEEKSNGWKLLFDGKSTEGWRNYRKDTISENWKVVDGTLTHSGNAGDIVTKEQYGAFELILEFKIASGGNSGLMYHSTEEADTPWMTGPEVQIQDNVAGHDPQKCGWLYQLYPATEDATKPAGQWNELRLLVTPEKCEHYVNGVKYVEYVKGSKDWDEKVAASKFSQFKNFGKPTTGYISLQDHGDEVAFRNIRIRDLTKK